MKRFCIHARRSECYASIIDRTTRPKSYSARHRCIALSNASTPSFSAISYTWGVHSRIDTFSLDGHRAFAPASALNAVRSGLQHFYSNPSLFNPEATSGACSEVRIWIDAISTDQQQTAERGEQVSLMREIYSRATQVLVWLGEDENGLATRAMAAVQQIIGVVDKQQLVLSSSTAICSGNTKWDTQGSDQGKVCLLVIGTPYGNSTRFAGPSIAWEDLALAAAWLVHRKYTGPACRGSVVEGIENAARIFKFDRLSSNDGPSLFGLSIQMDCSEPKDKVYGIHGMLSPALAASIATEYHRPLVATCIEVVKACIRHYGTLEVLQYAQAMFPPDGTQQKDHAWPTWLPHFEQSFHTRCGSPPYMALPYDVAADNGLKAPGPQPLSLLGGDLALAGVDVGEASNWIIPTDLRQDDGHYVPEATTFVSLWQTTVSHFASKRREDVESMFVNCIMLGRNSGGAPLNSNTKFMSDIAATLKQYDGASSDPSDRLPHSPPTGAKWSTPHVDTAAIEASSQLSMVSLAWVR
ncbi:hypothetical protein LTR86_001267 [Recurvomyces mirabilis]|nr:hypothetical protein LTR86_001267 [Recurvomyces mirabilis]